RFKRGNRRSGYHLAPHPVHHLWIGRILCRRFAPGLRGGWSCGTAGSTMAALQAAGRIAAALFMIRALLVFGGLGRRGIEALVAVSVLALAVALVALALMIVAGARHALARAERI